MKLLKILLRHYVYRVPSNILILLDCILEDPEKFTASRKTVQLLNLLAFTQSLLNPIIFFTTLHRMKRVSWNISC